jgi:biopolymer transport protein ExbB/biopolymer transport protein TolQ
MGNVMVGISEALIATGVGLLVAIPAVVGYNVAQKKVGQIDANVQTIAKQLLTFLKADKNLALEMRALSEPPPAVADISPLPGRVAAAAEPELS